MCRFFSGRVLCIVIMSILPFVLMGQHVRTNLAAGPVYFLDGASGSHAWMLEGQVQVLDTVLGLTYSVNVIAGRDQRNYPNDAVRVVDGFLGGGVGVYRLFNSRWSRITIGTGGDANYLFWNRGLNGVPSTWTASCRYGIVRVGFRAGLEYRIGSTAVQLYGRTEYWAVDTRKTDSTPLVEKDLQDTFAVGIQLGVAIRLK